MYEITYEYNRQIDDLKEKLDATRLEKFQQAIKMDKV